jgi:hypothetical protein
MIHGHDEKRKWRARPSVEPLEDRIVPSGVSALGTHAAAAAAAHVAAHPHQEVAAGLDATVNRFDKQDATQFDRASRGIDRALATDHRALSTRTGAVQLARSTSTIAKDFGQFVARSELQWNRTAGTLDNRFDQAVQRSVTTDPALEPAAMAAASNFSTTNAELGVRLVGELAAAQSDLQAAISSAEATAAGVRAHAPTARPAAAVRAAVGRAHHAPVINITSSVRAAVRPTATATAAAATSPFLAAGVVTATQFGTGGSPVNGAGLGPIPATMGTTAAGGIPGGAANGAFGVGTLGGTGDLLGGTQPSPVTGTTGAGVDTGLDTFGIGTGFGVGSGIDMTPNGDGLFF